MGNNRSRVSPTHQLRIFDGETRARLQNQRETYQLRCKLKDLKYQQTDTLVNILRQQYELKNNLREFRHESNQRRFFKSIKTSKGERKRYRYKDVCFSHPQDKSDGSDISSPKSTSNSETSKKSPDDSENEDETEEDYDDEEEEESKAAPKTGKSSSSSILILHDLDARVQWKKNFYFPPVFENQKKAPGKWDEFEKTRSRYSSILGRMDERSSKAIAQKLRFQEKRDQLRLGPMMRIKV